MSLSTVNSRTIMTGGDNNLEATTYLSSISQQIHNNTFIGKWEKCTYLNINYSNSYNKKYIST